MTIGRDLSFTSHIVAQEHVHNGVIYACSVCKLRVSSFDVLRIIITQSRMDDANYCLMEIFARFRSHGLVSLQDNQLQKQ